MLVGHFPPSLIHLSVKLDKRAVWVSDAVNEHITVDFLVHSLLGNTLQGSAFALEGIDVVIGGCSQM